MTNNVEYQKCCEEKFHRIMSFLREYPEYYSGRRDFEMVDKNELYSKFISSRFEPVILNEPNTIPDEAVGIILQAIFGYNAQKLEDIKITHLQSMAAENKVGELLEMYLAEKIEAIGWVWCSGNFVKAVDFLKWENGNWRLLQIKNRDNTENSSSSQIRNGTNIEKWFRTYSKPSSRRSTNTNWENFPEDIHLSEREFLSFISQKLSL